MLKTYGNAVLSLFLVLASVESLHGEEYNIWITVPDSVDELTEETTSSYLMLVEVRQGLAGKLKAKNLVVSTYRSKNKNHFVLSIMLSKEQARPIFDENINVVFRADGGDLTSITTLSDAAAEALAKSEDCLYLCSLTTLTDTAAEALSKHEGGELNISGLTTLSDAAAEALSKHEGDELNINGLATLSDAAAVALAKHEGGCLSLDGLATLSDAAAEALAKHPELHVGEDVEEFVNGHRG